jgi:hypothetical protein
MRTLPVPSAAKAAMGKKKGARAARGAANLLSDFIAYDKEYSKNNEALQTYETSHKEIFLCEFCAYWFYK